MEIQRKFTIAKITNKFTWSFHKMTVPVHERLSPFDNNFLPALLQLQFHEKHATLSVELLCNP